MDDFDRLESYISKWSLNHSWLIQKLCFYGIIWICTSIFVISTLGIVGLSTLDNSLTQSHNLGTMTDDAYNIWQDWLIPISLRMFDTVQLLGIFLAASYLWLTSYRYAKYTYKMRKKDEL